MRARISAEDIVATVLSEDFLRNLRKAGRYSEVHHVETGLVPYLDTATWVPHVNGIAIGGYNTMADALEKDQREVPSGGLPYMFVNFHPDVRVVIPSGVHGDLSLVLYDDYGVYEQHAQAHYSEDLSVRLRNIVGIAHQ